MNELTQEPESFIIRNVTLGPHYISDIRLHFEPLQAIDLTWEDVKTIKSSKDLRNSIRMGYLRQITAAEFETIEQKAAIKEKKELMRQQKNSNLSTVDIDGKTYEAEQIDAEKGGVSKDGTISTAGYANDSLSYATALDIAQTQAQLRGDELSVEDFADKVQQNPNLVNQLLTQYKNMQESVSVSGDTARGRAFVAEAPSIGQSGTSVSKVEMTNYNRDKKMAGSDFNYLDTPADFDDGVADVIDLELDGDGEKGGVRRV